MENDEFLRVLLRGGNKKVGGCGTLYVKNATEKL